jgi:hypothetical protein
MPKRYCQKCLTPSDASIGVVLRTSHLLIGPASSITLPPNVVQLFLLVEDSVVVVAFFGCTFHKSWFNDGCPTKNQPVSAGLYGGQFLSASRTLPTYRHLLIRYVSRSKSDADTTTIIKVGGN